jgi:hypothetical protein
MALLTFNEDGINTDTLTNDGCGWVERRVNISNIGLRASSTFSKQKICSLKILG